MDTRSVMLSRLFILILSFGMVVHPALAQTRSPPDIAAAEAALRAGQAEAAWNLLEPYEFEKAGEEDFDYLMGLAALESGRPDRASFILERVVGVNPNHAAAQLDLARALFVLGDHERARQQFEATLKLDPPAPARQAAERYLAAIDERRGGRGIRTIGYLEAGVGTDDNVNAGVSGGAYFMPILNASVSAQPRRVDYESFAAGAEVTASNAAGGDLFVGVDLKRRQHRHWVVDSTRNGDYYDTRSFEGRIGFQQKIGAANALRVSTGRSRQTLDDKHGYRRSQSLMAEWRHTFGAATQSSLWLLDQRSRYGAVGTTSYRQYGGDQLLAGLGLVRGFGQANALIAHVTAYGGAERATDRAAGNLDGDKMLGGVRVGGQIRLLPALDLTASVGGSLTRYELYNLLFLKHRRDHVWDAMLGAQWRLNKEWTLKPQYAYSRSDSNFGAYDNERHDYSVTLRYDFR
jgi:hypothetical protein